MNNKISKTKSTSSFPEKEQDESEGNSERNSTNVESNVEKAGSFSSEKSFEEIMLTYIIPSSSSQHI